MMKTATDMAVSANIQTTRLPTGATIEYLLEGPADAPVLCFVHGLGSNLRQFLPQAAHFSGRYQVLLLSLRGHGGSGQPNPATGDAYALPILAQDVAALLDQLGVPSLHFVGNSLGGLVGYELLQLGSPRLLSLTTFGTTAALHSPRLLYWTVVASVQLLGVNRLAKIVGKTSAREPAVGRQLELLYRQTTKEALRLIPQHIARYDYTDVLRRAALPLLLIQGELDREINNNLASTLAALAGMADGRVISLPNAGHFANMEQPDTFNKILTSFLAGELPANPLRPIS
jgi:pimeloyl-ACP methyl ester carboxylesterase